MPAHEYVNKGQFPTSKYRSNLLYRAVTLHDPEITERLHAGTISAPEVLKHLGSSTGVGNHWSGGGPDMYHMSREHHAVNDTPATVVMTVHHNEQMTDNSWNGQYEGKGDTLGEYHPTVPTQAVMHSMAVDTGDPSKPMNWGSDPHWRPLPGSAGLTIETYPKRENSTYQGNEE